MGDFNNNNVCQYAERLFFSAGNNSICHGLKPYSIFVNIVFKIYAFRTFHGFVLEISVAKSGNKLLSNIWLYWVVYIYNIYIWVWESYFLHVFKHYCNSMNYPNFLDWMSLNSANLSLSKNLRYARSCYSCFASISWVIWLIDCIQICILHYLLQFNI